MNVTAHLGGFMRSEATQVSGYEKRPVVNKTG
jgi:hypothetical protein